MKLKMIVLFLCGASMFSNAQQIKGVVSNVIDGNTIEVTTTDNENYTVLLHGIDSPDPGQNYAENYHKNFC